MTPNVAFAVPPENVEALAQAVVELVEDEPRRRALGIAARTLAQERYSWDAIAARLAEIYDLLAGRTPASATAA